MFYVLKILSNSALNPTPKGPVIKASVLRNRHNFCGTRSHQSQTTVKHSYFAVILFCAIGGKTKIAKI